ncbi:MAG: CPBP family intramembrane metalloprotease [Cellulosilyticum sp.]|nr:CPBP family intramembrane metalloprotease [Cellulosilyticum sp.]
MKKNVLRLETSRMIIGILLTLVGLIMAQLLAITIGTLPTLIGVPKAIGNIIAGVLYPVFILVEVKLICNKVLKLSLEKCKISKISLRPVWCIVAVVMPLFVCLGLMLLPGQFKENVMSLSDKWTTVTGAVVFIGLGVGIAEEMVFRGVIMSVLEHRYNKVVAIIVPSVTFALVHAIGMHYDFISIFQLLIAGSVVGILFSLVTYESGSIWNAALMHGIWNMSMIGGILNIGDSANERAIYNYVLDTNSRWISGGDFGIEASIISIVVYLIFIVLAGLLYKRKVK